MSTTTLRGVFPEPKRVNRRNFVRENISHLREMQRVVRKHGVFSKSEEIKPAKAKNVAPKVYSFTNAKRKLSDVQNPKNHRNKANFERKVAHIGVQTEKAEDVAKLYEHGVLKYPSPSIVAKSQEPKEQGDHGLVKNMTRLDLEDKQNYIKQNIKNIKTNKLKKESSTDPTQPPLNYQKGVLPKYLLQEKKQDVKNVETDNETLAGFVVLPDDERKEYLRVARENYASLIRELNSMPLSNDTLKKRRRKIEIEDELKRLDEVIKIFQRPKVFVRADA